MSAAQKTLTSPIRNLGIIAGGGSLPERLISACEQKNINAFIVGFEGHTDPGVMKGRQHMWTRLGAAGQIFSTLKAHEIEDLVLIGSIRRPTLGELRPDLKTAEFFARVGFRALGDNDLLGVLRSVLEEEGFKIHGVHKFAEDLLAGEGILGKHKPKKADWSDIRRGLEISQNLGELDVGQSAIVQEGIVLGVEAAEGTDELMRRCKYLHRKGRAPILIKTCKPQQDRDFDLPTIGPQTVMVAAQSGLGGIVVHAGLSLMVDPEETIRLANEKKLFLLGVIPEKELSHP